VRRCKNHLRKDRATIKLSASLCGQSRPQGSEQDDKWSFRTPGAASLSFVMGRPRSLAIFGANHQRRELETTERSIFPFVSRVLAGATRSGVLVHFHQRLSSLAPFNLRLAPSRVTRLAPKISMAGLVSPASSWKQGLISTA